MGGGGDGGGPTDYFGTPNLSSGWVGLWQYLKDYCHPYLIKVIECNKHLKWLYLIGILKDVYTSFNNPLAKKQMNVCLGNVPQFPTSKKTRWYLKSGAIANHKVKSEAIPSNENYC